MRVVLDANVLYSQILRDVFFEFAVFELIQVHWSLQIKQEVTNNLGLRNANYPEAFLKATGYLERALPGTLTQYSPSIWNNSDVDEKDWHVYDLAIQAEANFIVTWNLKDFPAKTTQPGEPIVVTPDQILVSVFIAHQPDCLEALKELHGSYVRPPMSWERFLSLIESTGCVNFARLLPTDFN